MAFTEENEQNIPGEIPCWTVTFGKVPLVQIFAVFVLALPTSTTLS